MQFFPTAVCNVTAWRHSRLRAHWLMALVEGEGAEGELCILRSPGIAASSISLLSMGRVCGRSLTAGKILFTGRQICSLYLVLWLCGWAAKLANKEIPVEWAKFDDAWRNTQDAFQESLLYSIAHVVWKLWSYVRPLKLREQ